MMMAILELDRLVKRFGSDLFAVNRLSLSLTEGEFLCLIGPSGCGKSTLLRLIAGYLLPDEGAIFLAGQNITALPPEARQIGMVFQNYALFPHLSASENVAFGLRVRRTPAGEIRSRVADVLDWVGLSHAERQRRPRELSGGQQQRVALARALVTKPRVLMLDEPFANLDRQLRERLREELRTIQRQAGLTTILVTHDREEAMTLADRVGIMQAGSVVQVGLPREIYERPQTEFVARFMGPATLLTVTAVTDATVETSSGLTLHRLEWPEVASGDVLCVRPEAWQIGLESDALPDRWTGTIIESTFAGSHSLVSVRIGVACVVQVQLSSAQRDRLGPAPTLSIGLGAAAATIIRAPLNHLFSTAPAS